ncbi:MAG TPA: AMP-binding protein, partial [Chitinophagaceae bacterium]|nr:AMP-binding protein [Chitinophagaceae bacterium]
MQHSLMHTAFEKNAQQWPGKIAVKENGREITYLFLNTQANYLAKLLRQAGARKETTVAYIGSTGIDLVASLLSIFKAGSVYLPIDFSLPVKRIEQM